MKIFTNPMNFCRLYLSGEGFIGSVVNVIKLFSRKAKTTRMVHFKINEQFLNIVFFLK